MQFFHSNCSLFIWIWRTCLQTMKQNCRNFKIRSTRKNFITITCYSWIVVIQLEWIRNYVATHFNLERLGFYEKKFIFCLPLKMWPRFCQTLKLNLWYILIPFPFSFLYYMHDAQDAVSFKIEINIFFFGFHSQDHKLKNMAELQQSVVTDQDTRHQIQTQILTWEENLERLHCEQFRLRCYMASLQGGELPNPKVCANNSISTVACVFVFVFWTKIPFL